MGISVRVGNETNVYNGNIEEMFSIFPLQTFVLLPTRTPVPMHE